MDTPLEILARYSIPTDSYIRAVARAGEINLGKTRFEQVIADLVGSDIPPVYSNEKEARMYFRYTVQETVKGFLGGQIPDMDAVWERVQQFARTFIRDHAWCIREYVTEAEVRQDAAGNPKQKKGAKKEQAELLYLKLNDGINDRTVIIQAFIDEISLTKQGATTYFHNCRKEFGYKGPKTERKQREKKAASPKAPIAKKAKAKRKGPSKSAIAATIYQRMLGAPKAEVLAAIVEEANTSPAGANTYFCSCKNKFGNGINSIHETV